MTYSIFSFQIRASWMLKAAICYNNPNNKKSATAKLFYKKKLNKKNNIT
jgi:hypothetical protein